MNKEYTIKIKNREFNLIDIMMFLGLLLIGYMLRRGLSDFESGDWEVFLEPWTNQIKQNGFRSLAVGYYNYTPTYMYVLWFITKLPIDTLFGIKAFSILFDLILAFAVSKVVITLKPGSNWLVPFGVIWLLPTVVSNSAMWGQCDSIYTAFLVLSLLYILKDKPNLAMVFWGIAFALKLQSVFFAPILVLLFVLKKIRIRDFLWVPAIYIISIIPAWIAGRPLKELLLIYMGQTGRNPTLSVIYPNIYYLIGNDVYMTLFTGVAIWFTFGVLLVMMYYVLKKTIPNGITNELLIQVTLLCGSIIVFLLPNMRERYSYFIDIVAIIYAFIYVKKMYVAIARVMISYMAYTTYYRFGMYTSYEVLAVILILLLIDQVYMLYVSLKETKVSGVLCEEEKS